MSIMSHGMKLTYLTIAPGVTKQVWLRNATKDVILLGKISHFLNGIAGVTWSCAFANMWLDLNNRSRVPHPVRVAHIIKTRAYICIGELNGILVFVQYTHNYGTKVDLNDYGTLVKIIQNRPEELEQEYVFRVPSVVKRNIGVSIKRTNSGVRKNFFPKGATARALKAGFITQQEAEEYANKQQDEYEYKRTMAAMKK